MRAAAAPCVSIFHAACSVISRAACICAAESAIQFWTVCLSPSTEPCATRYVARSQSMSNARRATPSQRMQWWMRPGHEALLGEQEARARAPSRFSAGTRTAS